MKIFLNIIFFLIVLAGVTSCEQNINIDLPYTGDKIVLNAILNKDSILYAHITKSAPTEKDVSSFEELQGCKADLYENDVFIETLKETAFPPKRYYISTAKIKSDAKYSIRVISTGLSGVEGNDVVPQKASFLPIEYWKLTNTADSLRPYKLTVKLNDPGGVKNYYRMRIYPASYNANTRRYSINRNNELSFGIDNFADQGSIFGSFDDNLSRVDYFTDETFDGQEITLNISLRYMNNERTFIAPEISQLSRSAYLYFDSRRKQEQSEDNPFAEAVVVYNNIQNGFGIVGAVADSIRIIRRMN